MPAYCAAGKRRPAACHGETAPKAGTIVLSGTWTGPCTRACGPIRQLRPEVPDGLALVLHRMLAMADTLTKAAVVIEILGPTTEAYDRGLKFREYEQLSSVGEYILVSQEEPLIERGPGRGLAHARLS